MISDTGYAAPQYIEFAKLEPDEVTGAGSRTWWVRGQNFAMCYAQAAAGERFARDDHPDEYVVLLPHEDSTVEVVTGDGGQVVTGRSVVVVPPGKSEVRARTRGELVLLYTSASADLLARCRNQDAYAQPHERVAPLEPWPAPDEWRVRAYPLAEAPDDAGRFGRIFRCTTFMVNYLYPEDGPRDPERLSPHLHDDFEQISLQLEGDYVHHIRTPWTTRLSRWREDDHRRCAAPAVTIIPAGTIHTSQGVHDMRHQLVDIFCPPRVDFSQRPGWVLNASDYPA